MIGYLSRWVLILMTLRASARDNGTMNDPGGATTCAHSTTINERIKAMGSTASEPHSKDHDDTTEHTGSYDDSGQVAMRPKKRQSTTDLSTSSAKKRRLRRGKLQDLPNMPIDILYEIFSFLQPIDVLNLARSTKPLRAILLNRSSRTVWKSALSNYGPRKLPECPFDLNEPQYVDLAFSKHCHFCPVSSGSGVKTIIWKLRVRCCESCKKDPSCLHILSKSEYYRLKDKKQQQQQTLIPCVSLPPARSDAWGSPNRIVCLRSAYTALNTELSQVVGRKRKRVRDAWKERTMRIIEDAERCEEWHKLVTLDAVYAREYVRRRRATAIRAKLREAGWGDELNKLSNCDTRRFRQLAVVKEPKELTERAWAEMAPSLLRWMQTTRIKRIEYERPFRMEPGVRIVRQIIDRYASTLPIDAAVPGVADVCLMEPFWNVLANCPEDVVFVEADFEDAITELPRLYNEWLADAKALLLQHTELAPGSDAAAIHLDLAITQFVCSECRPPWGFTAEEALTHRHDDDISETAANQQNAFLLPAFRTLKTRPWDINAEGRPSWVHDPWLEQCGRNVVAACGRDADVTTLAEMNALDPWLQCKPCSASRFPHKAFSWRSAVQHAFRCHKSSKKQGSEMWRVLNAADTDGARAQKTLQSVYQCKCKRCRESFWFTTREDENHRRLCLESHLRSTHGTVPDIQADFVETMEYDTHCVLH